MIDSIVVVIVVIIIAVSMIGGMLNTGKKKFEDEFGTVHLQKAYML